LNEELFAPVEVLRTRTRKQCQEYALVLRSLGVPFHVVNVGAAFGLLVPREHAALALSELESYHEENVDWPPRVEPAKIRATGKYGAIAYGVAIILMHAFILYGPVGRNWKLVGKVDAARIVAGEWWRTITALTLHGDMAHLAGNLVAGIAFAVLASHSVGSGLAWFLFVLSGALGNYVNALVQPETHTAIGASTAVFGVLGVLTAYEWMRRRALHYPPLRRIAPLLGGAVLLGFLGVGGEGGRTDVMAHFFGFGMGLVLGALTGFLRLPDRLGETAQIAIGLLAPVLVVVGWLFATG